MINIVQSKTVIGQCSLMHYQTIRLVGVAAMLTPADARPWLVTRFCKKHAFSNTGNKFSKIQFLITCQRPYTNGYVRKRSALLEFLKMYHGKRKSDRAAMVSDCIGSPWLRGFEAPYQTVWWRYKMAGKNYFLFKLFRRMYRETISYSYYSGVCTVSLCPPTTTPQVQPKQSTQLGKITSLILGL